MSMTHKSLINNCSPFRTAWPRVTHAAAAAAAAVVGVGHSLLNTDTPQRWSYNMVAQTLMVYSRASCRVMCL